MKYSKQIKLAKVKKAIVIGETKLCTQCAEHLLNRNWKIICVVSDDAMVLDWARKHNLPTLPSVQLNTIKERNFYLFSIINPAIIAKDFLANKKVIFALNYHDSLLPKYAGLNSTTWAIINNEKSHGITLHQISVGIDDGDVVAQSVIKLLPNDTVASLNLISSKRLLGIFPGIIDKIESGSLPVAEQDMTGRTYFGAKVIPKNYAIINGTTSLEEIYRLSRALDFGYGYVNPIATVKICIDKQFYIAENFNLDCLQQGKRITDNAIIFNQVRDIYGNKTELNVTYQHLIKPCRLTDAQLQYLVNIKASERKQKHQIINLLNEFDASIQVLNHALAEEGSEPIVKQINTSLRLVTKLALTYFVLARLFYSNKFIVSMYQNDASISTDLLGLVANRSFLCVSQEMLLKNFLQLKLILAERKRHVLVNDFAYRYGLQLQTDVAIVQGEVTCIDKHKIIINITDTAILVKGSTAYQQQISNIATALEAIIHQHLIKNDLRTVNILNRSQYKQIVWHWNHTNKHYAENKTLLQLFKEQATTTPSNIAVIDSLGCYSYATIQEQMLRLASVIYKQQKTTQKLIAILSEKGLPQVVAALSIMQTGNAFLPLNLDWPIKRISQILIEGQVKQLLVSEQQFSRIKDSELADNYQIIVIEQIIKAENSLVVKQFPQITPQDIAYVIFTSGSTGVPKGVTIAHHGAVNTIYAINQKFHVTAKDKVLALSELSFDLSIYDIFGFLAVGGTIVFPEQSRVKEPEHWIELINKYQITIWNSAPQLMQLCINQANDSNQSIESLRAVMLSGDWIPPSLPKQIKAANPKARVMSLGGATEGSIWSIWFEIATVDPKWVSIPYGYPMPNQKIYILDDNFQPLPIGVVGEICIGGVGVALGYWNDTEKTAAAFIEHPQFGRIYKTGDLGEWDKNGYAIILGRKNTQVKINGNRVDLAEIGVAITKLPGIKDAIALIQSYDNKKHLIAYYLTKPQAKITHEQIQQHLQQNLPEYMVPAAYVELASFPLTLNGKLDYKALPIPELVEQDTYLAPTTALQKKIAAIWSETLGIKKIGINDNFFRIGGDSILSIMLIAKMHKAGFWVLARDIFEHKTIANLEKLLQSEQSKIKTLSESGILSGEFSLLPIQKWFIAKVKQPELANYNHWNQSFLIYVPELDLQKLKQVIPLLVNQHDMLRATFKKDALGNYLQNYNSEIKIPELKILDVSNFNAAKLHAALTNWQSNFDIAQGPLWQIGYLYGYQDKSARIYFACHHLIIDAVSWRILAEDLKALYHSESLAPKTTSYRQWVQFITSYTIAHASEIHYWLKQQHTQNNYQQDFAEKTHVIEFALDSTTTNKLLKHSSHAYHTEINDLLLTALAYVLSSWNKQKVNHIALEGHGREQLAADMNLTRTVGWFTAIYPVTLEIKASLAQSIKCIKENLRNIPNKGIGFGAFKYNGNTHKLADLPPISFNYYGQFASQKAFWQIVAEDSGVAFHSSNKDTNIININCAVIADQLKFNLATHLSAKTSQFLSTELIKYLEQITEHCLEKIQQQATEFTPSDFNLTISQELIDKLQQQDSATANAIAAIYPANSLQQGFVYHAISQPTDDAYRVQVLFDYQNTLHVANYQKAWELALECYPILRTSFNWDEEVIQIIHRQGKLNFTFFDLTAYKNPSAKVKQTQIADREQRFDLTKPTQLRLYLLQQNRQHFSVILSVHHAIIDGWSIPLLISKVHKLYYELQQNITPKTHEDLTYFRAQEYYQQHLPEVKSYWQRQIQTIEEVNDLNPLLSKKIDLNAIKALDETDEVKINLSDDLYLSLKCLAKKHGVTIHSILQFAWHKLIQIYTQSTQTIVGTVVSGRDIPIAGIETSVGLYINTLPLVIDWQRQAQTSILDQLKSIQQQVTELNHQYFINLANLQKHAARLFHSIFVFENYPNLATTDEATKLKIEFHGIIEKLDYPLGVVIYENSAGLSITLKYAKAYLEKSKAVDLLQKIQLILTQVINENNKVSSVNILTATEYKQLVYKNNFTEKAYPKNKTLAELFALQVKRMPKQVAVVFADKKLTYSELNSKANQLARYLREQYLNLNNQELKADTLIAICLERSLESIIAIFAVLKAGAAYVPIDPDYPSERINYILKDTKANLIVTQAHLKHILQPLISEKQRLIVLDDKHTAKTMKCLATTNIPEISTSQDLAYVIYTSGSTGNPKGVLIKQTSVVAMAHAHIPYYKLGKNCLQFAPLVFDSSVVDIFTVLLFGLKLILVTKEQRKDASKLHGLLLQEKVQVALFPPAFLESFDAYTKYLRVLMVGGAVPEQAILDKYYKAGVKVFNMYGPTEITVCSSINVYKHNGANNIGKALPNSKLYILDNNLLPVPRGVIGELYIGGSGLARGYLNQPELTQAKFVPNPFATAKDKADGYTRLYKTGDLVKWRDDGSIDYIGRNDFQVKIRGFRIELGEIESAIAKIKGIKQVTVQAREKKTEAGTNKFLVAYYIKEERSHVSAKIISATLKQVLPEYMLPATYVELKIFPLTINGKLDSKALPDPEFTEVNKYVAPNTELETKLCHIWQELLGLKKVGINDDFFLIGGNSISCLALQVKLQKLGFALSIQDLVQQKTIANIAKALQVKASAGEAKYEPYIIFNKNKTLPIFMLPPGEGGAESYFNNLVPALGDRHLIIFNNWYRHLLAKYGTSAVKELTYENLAAKYVKHIKKLQPQGPYTLFGWSFGGVLAFAIAKELVKAHAEVAKIVMLDSIFALQSAVQKLHIKGATQLLHSDINYKYYPQHVGFNPQTQIILFKATKLPEATEFDSHQLQNEAERNLLTAISNYYVHKTRDNGLAKVLAKNTAKIIPIAASHYSWVHNPKVIKQIAAKIGVKS